MKSSIKNDTKNNSLLAFKQEKLNLSYQDKMEFLMNCSQEYMKLSLHFLNKNMLYASLLLCNRALESMLNAVYIEQEKRLFISNIFLDDMLRVLSKDSGMNMESIIFIQSLSFLSQERSLICKMQPAHLVNLINKADELLLQLSSQLALSSGTYHSVFEK